MTKDFKTGILTSSIYYGVGLALAIITTLIWKNEYAHAPGPPFLVAALFLIGGILLLLFNLLLLKNASNRNREKGSILVHALILGSSGIFIAVVIIQSKYKSNLSNNDSEYLIVGEKPGTLTITKGPGDTTFFQKKGKVIIDKDSITRKESEK
ncbi:hypothetical protein AHMF7605_20530 [Adhaeribacter arboris]|uniref:Uncharacterized protein n=1 Tax=Adhaeribacter arboris TaxID=2072846 RepID=A0A2T2YJQ5_9BACT|nr:hypothetical protein [Adhaeribacter arboris]PSR55719.1 hypothetical protein AHMF7605_20530 [Adhaeribacter arboris]